MEKVELSIDRYTYYVSRDRVNAFPNSYFAVALSPHWNSNAAGESGAKLRIEGRSVELFEHIVNFINFGCIPRGSNGDYLIDRKLLPALREEADYFCLQELVNEIDNMRSDLVSTILREGLKFKTAIEDFNQSDHKDLIIGVDVMMACRCGKLFSHEKQKYKLYERFSDALYDAYGCGPFVTVGEGQWQAPIMKGVGSITIDTMRNDWERNQRDWKCELDSEILESIAVSVGELENPGYQINFLFAYAVVTTSTAQFSTTVLSCDFACLIVVVPTTHVGGDITIVSSDKEDTYTVKTDELPTTGKPERFKFIVIQSKVTINIAPILSGKQMLLVYKLYCFTPCPYLKTSPVSITNVINKKIDKFVEVMVFIATILSLVGYVGIMFENNYVSKGLTVQSLSKFDAELYAKIVDMGIPVSLLYAIRENEIQDDYDDIDNDFFNIRLLNDERFDTRLPIHKTTKFMDSKVPYIAIADFDIGYSLNENQVNRGGYSLNEKQYTGKKYYKSIVAAMIIGSGLC